MRGSGREILTRRNPFAPGERRTGMRILFALLVLALAALEIESSRVAARLAAYPDASASPALLAR